MVSIKLSLNQAIEARDTLAKSLYSNLFDWVIKFVNISLKTSAINTHSSITNLHSIGILDIFGFEVFQVS